MTFRVGAWLGLQSVALLLAASPALADDPGTAADGLTFASQSAATKNEFTSTFGSSCAAQEWAWQHSLTVEDSDLLDGPAAADGQTLAAQDDDIQIMFVAWFGPKAIDEWNAEHNALVNHKVMLSTVAPVPCPPAKSTAAPKAIGTTHLSDAVESAQNGDVGGAFSGFQAFKIIWNAAKPNVMKVSPGSVDGVQAAVDQVNALLGDPKAAPPPQSQYLPALQNLLKVVRTANTAVASGGTPVAATTSSAAPPVSLPQIRAGNLGESVDAAGKSDLAGMRKEFGEFQDDWDRVSDAYHAGAPSVATNIEAAITQLQGIIGDPSQSPAQAQYLPVIQNLQKLVLDANAKAGAAPGPAPAQNSPAMPAKDDDD
jgi:hypothetical protein